MEKTRVKRLLELINNEFNGNKTAFSKKTEMSSAQISQYLHGYRSIGEKVARKIEKATSKPFGWLDNQKEANELINIENEYILKMLKIAKEEEIEVIKYILNRTYNSNEKPFWVTKEIDNNLDVILYAALKWIRNAK